MLVCNTYIAIGNWEFYYCHSIEIDQDINTLTDTCRITLPRKAKLSEHNRFKNHDFKDVVALGDDTVFKLGDAVTVKLGYDGNLKTRFMGFVRDIKVGAPVTIICEDGMYQLKKNSLTLSYKNVSLQQLVKDIIPAGVSYKVIGDKNINIGLWRITKASAAKVLEEIKSKFGIYSCFRNITEGSTTQSVLHVGLAYWVDHRKEEVFEFSGNIINHDLEYKRKEDIRLKAKATSWQRDNTKIEVEVGDEDGEERSINAYNLTKEQLIVYANAELERYKYTGFRGNFLTFGEPLIEKGDIAYLLGDQYHPSGKYLVKSIRISGGVNGYRQQIYLGPQISDNN